MNRTFLAAAFAGILMCGGLFAQTTPSTDPSAPQAQPSPTQPAQPQEQAAPPTNQNAPSAQAAGSQAPGSSAPKIAPGSVIPVQLTKSIDAKKVKTGDEVIAKVTQDMKTASGEVLVPKDTKIVGHVTEAQARTKEQKESQLGIAFDHAVLKNGDVQVPMSIQAIVGQQNNNPNAPGGESEGPAASPSAPSAGGSAKPGMAGAAPAPSPSRSESSSAPSDAGAAKNSTPPINGQTQGVIGIPNMTLAPGANATQGSVVTSDKNNVKLESGTMLLLKVSQ